MSFWLLALPASAVADFAVLQFFLISHFLFSVARTLIWEKLVLCVPPTARDGMSRLMVFLEVFEPKTWKVNTWATSLLYFITEGKNGRIHDIVFSTTILYLICFSIRQWNSNYQNHKRKMYTVHCETRSWTLLCDVGLASPVCPWLVITAVMNAHGLYCTYIKKLNTYMYMYYDDCVWRNNW